MLGFLCLENRLLDIIIFALKYIYIFFLYQIFFKLIPYLNITDIYYIDIN